MGQKIIYNTKFTTRSIEKRLIEAYHRDEQWGLAQIMLDKKWTNNNLKDSEYNLAQFPTLSAKIYNMFSNSKTAQIPVQACNSAFLRYKARQLDDWYLILHQCSLLLGVKTGIKVTKAKRPSLTQVAILVRKLQRKILPQTGRTNVTNLGHHSHAHTAYVQ